MTCCVLYAEVNVIYNLVNSFFVTMPVWWIDCNHVWSVIYYNYACVADKPVVTCDSLQLRRCGETVVTELIDCFNCEIELSRALKLLIHHNILHSID